MTQMTQDAKAAVPGFVAHMTTFTVDHAEGSWVYGTDGSKWLDFVMGIAVVNTGHCHPKVVAAVRGAGGQDHPCPDERCTTSSRCSTSREKLLRDRARRHGPGPLRQLRRRGGRERRQARQAGTLRRPGVIAFQGAFHGRTHLTMALTDSRPCTTAATCEPLVGGIYHARYCVSVPHARPARTRPTTPSTTCAASCAPRSTADDIAAILFEPIQGEGGFIVATAGFVHALRKLADQYKVPTSSPMKFKPASAAPAAGSTPWSTTASQPTS